MKTKYTKVDNISPPHKACTLIAQGKYDKAIDELEHRRTDIYKEVRTLYNAVLRLRPPVCIEAGTRQGESTTAIMAALEQTGGELYSVDIEQAKVPKWLKRHPRWHFTQGDSVDYGKAWIGGKVRFIFIDTSHWFNDTLHELETYLPLLEVGGESYWHDTREPWEVGKAIRAYLRGHGEYSYKEVGGNLAGMGMIKREI